MLRKLSIVPSLFVFCRYYATTPGKVKMHVLTSDNTDVDFDVPVGLTVMEAIRDVGELFVEDCCTGKMACTTCHVYVDEKWYPKVGPPSEEEQDMLDQAYRPTEYSRLGCQMKLTEELDGIKRCAGNAQRQALFANFVSYSTPGKVKINLTTQDGTKVDFQAPVGESLMCAIRDTAKLEMEGACDGCMQCGTCHVYLSEAWYKKVKQPKEEEMDVLDKSLDVKDTSRLSCQIELTPEMDGIEVQLPKEVVNLMM